MWGWRDGITITVLPVLTRTQVQFPAATWQLTTSIGSSDMHVTPHPQHTHTHINDRGDLKVLVIYQSSVMERMWFELCME